MTHQSNWTETRAAWRRLITAWREYRAAVRRRNDARAALALAQRAGPPMRARDYARAFLAEHPARASYPTKDNRPQPGLHRVGDCQPIWINSGHLQTLQLAGYLIIEEPEE